MTEPLVTLEAAESSCRSLKPIAPVLLAVSCPAAFIAPLAVFPAARVVSLTAPPAVDPTLPAAFPAVFATPPTVLVAPPIRPPPPPAERVLVVGADVPPEAAPV